MLSIWSSTLISVLLVSLISLIGIFFLSMKQTTLSKILILLVSFATGALFGDVFIHLLPELATKGITTASSLYILAGIMLFFILEKFVQWRHCHAPTKEHHHVHPLATMNLVGDGLHNLIDGMIIAGSYLASFPLGIATTIAVFLHEIPQEIGDFGILLHAGLTRGKAIFFNFLSALMAMVGAIFVLTISSTQNILSIILPITAGGFIYIAGSDLMPELHREKCEAKGSLLQLIAILAGIAVMYLLKFIG